MLIKHYPSIRPASLVQTVLSYFDPTLKKYADSKKITINEAKIRDEKVRSLYYQCQYSRGDKALVAGPLGEVVDVVDICKNYPDMENIEWPKDGNPMIVTFKDSKGELKICTTNYLILYKEKVTC